MEHQELFKFLFPGDELTKQVLAQPNYHTWWDALEEKLKPIVMKRGQMLSVKGNKPESIYFLYQGAIKGYHYHLNIEQVIYLWDSPSVVGDITSYFEETLSDLYIEVVQDASLLMLERDALEGVFLEFPESFIFLTSILLKYARYHQEVYMDAQTLYGFEKFEKLLSTRKMIDMIFSKSDLASFLGVSRSSVSAFYRKKSR